MYKRWKETGGKGSQEREREEGDQTNPLSFPCPSSLLVLSSLPPFLSIPLCLCHLPFSFFTSFIPSLNLSLSVHISIHLSFSFSTISSEPFHSLPSLLLQFTSLLLQFFVVIPSLSSIHFMFFSLPFFPVTLLSPSLSPSIVVVVDFAIRAEDMSFLSTRFGAQHDYTKPLSTVSIAVTYTHLQRQA